MKINFASLAIIAENLGILLADGIEISYAMELLLELQINKEYKKELINIKKKIIKGDTLYNSFRCSPTLFPDFFTGLIMLGEQSGEINRVLISLNKYYEKMDKIKKEIIGATIYPIILLVVILLISVIVVVYVIPNLYEILKSINKEMPTFIIKMYNFKNYFLQYKIFCITFFISYFILIPI
ncbi:MAG: hypothetical protein GX275_03565, partial [Clostridiales bacterium]|nr:hypothetical protein [Clostridiales bacterium]